MKRVSVPAAMALKLFTDAGYTHSQFVGYLDALMMYWRVNDNIYSVTRDFILMGMDLDELSGSYFWNTVSGTLTAMGIEVRKLARDNKLISWQSTPGCILLEIEDETYDSLDSYPTAY